jgi:hypothetical protein
MKVPLRLKIGRAEKASIDVIDYQSMKIDEKGYLRTLI